MEAFLRALLPRLLPQAVSFEVHPFQGKSDLLLNLERRLRGFAAWMPANWRLVVVVDRDDDDCHKLKLQLEAIASRAGLLTRTRAKGGAWQVANRVAVEELEAWYFGDWKAVCASHPRVSANVPRRRGFRDPDAIAGGTWQAFERVMRQHGYYQAGLTKIEAARIIGAHVDPQRSNSPSFKAFCAALTEP